MRNHLQSIVTLYNLPEDFHFTTNPRPECPLETMGSCVAGKIQVLSKQQGCNYQLLIIAQLTKIFLAR